MSNLAKISSNQVPTKVKQDLSNAIFKEFKRLKLNPDIPAEKDQLSDLIRDSKKVKEILEEHAPNFRIKALNDFLRLRSKNPKGKNLIQLTPQGTDKGNIRRAELSRQPGGEAWSRKGSLEEFLKSEKTKEFLNLPIIQTYDEDVVEKFFYETHRDTLALKNALRKANEGLDRHDPKRRSWGHFNRLSRSVDTPENVFLELLSENLDKKDRYKENPDSMLAIGNPTKEDVGWLKNWERVFLSWADKPENGGDGLLPQRGQYDYALEKQFRDIGGDQYNKLSLKEQADRRNQINDLIHVQEQNKANQPPKHQWLTNPLKTNLPKPLPNPIADKENAPIKALENAAAFGLEQSVNLAGSGIGDPNLGTKGRKILTGAKKISEGRNIEGAVDILSNASITTNEPIRSEYKAIQRDIKLDESSKSHISIVRFDSGM